LPGKLLTKNYILLLASFLAVSAASNMLNSTLPMYALHIGAANSAAGLVTGVFALSSLLTRPLFGYLLDKKGRSIILLSGILACCLMMVSYNWVGTVAVLLVVRFFHGFTMGAYSTSFGTMAADLIPTEKLVAGYGYYSLIQTLAASAGPMIGLDLAARSSYHLLFTIAAAVAAVGLAAAFLIDYERKNKKAAEARPLAADRISLKNIFEKTAIPLATAVFFLSISTGAVLTFLPPYAIAHGIKSIGIYFVVNAVTIFLMRLVLAPIINRIGMSRAIIGAMGLIAGSMLILVFVTTIEGFILAAVINGFGGGIIFPVLNSLIIRFAPADRRGAANATYYVGIDSGIGFGSVAGGVISQALGYPALFSVAAASIVVTFVIFLIQVMPKVQKETGANRL
jgi:MFS family permease